MRLLTILISCIVLTTLAHADDHEAEIQALFQKTKTASYPGGTFTAPMSWKVGQWVLIGLTDDDNEKSIIRQAIIARDGDWWTIESRVISEDDIVTIQMEMRGLDKVMKGGDMDEIEFRKIRMKTNDDDVIEIDGFMLDMAKGMYKQSMKNWVHHGETFTQGQAVTVPAGTFAGTSLARSTVSFMGSDIESDCWFSPSVPITGMVKSADSDGNTQVLLDFGLEGAQASF